MKTEVWAAGPAEALTAFKPLACAAPVSVLVIIGLPLDLELNCQTASGLAWPVLSLYPIRRPLSTPKSALGHIHLTRRFSPFVPGQKVCCLGHPGPVWCFLRGRGRWGIHRFRSIGYIRFGGLCQPLNSASGNFPRVFCRPGHPSKAVFRGAPPHQFRTYPSRAFAVLPTSWCAFRHWSHHRH